MHTEITPSSDTRSKLLDAAFLEIYTHGYHGAATATILKQAGVPKGSMYHFFGSKKELALAVIKERVFPKMNVFFNFEKVSNETIFESLERIFEKMGTHGLLITNGCPMHRLMVEMAPLDKDFEKLLTKQFAMFVSRLSSLLQTAIDNHELQPLDTQTMARFFITSTWGELSLPSSLSSRQAFRKHTDSLLTTLDAYKTTI